MRASRCRRRGRVTKQGYEVIAGGTLLWIPEETHEVNKDISLLQVEDGQFVDASTEIVKDIFCQCAGVVEVVQKNDILREAIVKPGELHEVADVEEFLSIEPQIVRPGDRICGIDVECLKYVEPVETPDGPALLFRPIEEFPVSDDPSVPSQESTDLRLRSVQRIPFKDGDRVRSVEGVELLRTQLVLEIGQDAPQLAADIELVGDPEDPEIQRLQIVILESLVIRRDISSGETHGSTQTQLLVEDGQQLQIGSVVASTQILSKEPGEVRGIREGAEALRRILVVRDRDMEVVEVPADAKIPSKGEFVVAGYKIAPDRFLETSGQIVGIEPGEDATTKQLRLRHARPYRISNGAALLVEDGTLVQRGDTLVLLVFERAKTGDIIQGLPRIEELLEARKPKEACLLARHDGTVEVAADGELIVVRVVREDGEVQQEDTLGSSQSITVGNGQRVGPATPLTDGPANPHEILDIFFNYYQERGDSVYESTCMAMRQVQSFLVNEVQAVYQSQGIDIADKHIEVIVRQMTSKVKIEDEGDTTMLPGELVELRQSAQVNAAMEITGGAPSYYRPVLLGITKASLNTDSFVSAASFQETTRVLTEAAIEGKSDWLRGLKENVIIGRLIPAGTGFNAYEETYSSYPESNGDGMDVGEADAEVTSMVLDDNTARSYGAIDGLTSTVVPTPGLAEEMVDDGSAIGDARLPQTAIDDVKIDDGVDDGDADIAGGIDDGDVGIDDEIDDGDVGIDNGDEDEVDEADDEDEDEDEDIFGEDSDDEDSGDGNGDMDMNADMDVDMRADIAVDDNVNGNVDIGVGLDTNDGEFV